MTPGTDFREEGNSVDPPNRLASPVEKETTTVKDPRPPSLSDGKNQCNAVGNSETFVYESSTTSSRLCVGTYFFDRDAQAANMSVVENETSALSSVNESNSSTTIPMPKDMSEKILSALAKDSFSDLQLGRQPERCSFQQSEEQSFHISLTSRETNCCLSEKTATSETACVTQIHNTKTSSNSQQSKEQVRQAENSSFGEPSKDFKFETSDLACRLKPQLTSNFLSKEMDSTPDIKIDVDRILRKYGIETREYRAPDALWNYASGKNFRKLPSSTTQSYGSFSSCRSLSMIDKTNAYSSDRFKHSRFPVTTYKHMDISQNNEALGELLNSNMEANNSLRERKVEGTSAIDHKLTNALHLTSGITDHKLGAKNGVSATNIGLEKVRDSTTDVQSSTGFDKNMKNNFSKNNDSQESDLAQKEEGPQAEVNISAAHGSSVDIAVKEPNEGLFRYNKSFPPSPGGSYSVSRGSTTVTAYPNIYSTTGLGSGLRVGGFSMSSQPSNMDVSPFEGTYLKHHMSIPKYSSSAGFTMSTPDSLPSMPSSAGGSKDTLTSNDSSLATTGRLGSPTDALGYSLQKERYRLRNIDNLITSGAARTPRPYSTMPYMSIHYSATNSPATLSRADSMGGWGNNSVLPGAASYDNPTDIATIRRGGSNVDTGEYNNNRGVLNGRRTSKYNLENSERFVRKPWESERGRNQSANRIHQLRKTQQQSQQHDGKRQTKPPSSKIHKGMPSTKVVQRKCTVVNQSDVSKSNARKNGSAGAREKNNIHNNLPQFTYFSRKDPNGGYQTNHSYKYNAIANGFDFARQLNRMWSKSVLGENYEDENVSTFHGEGGCGHNDCTDCCHECASEEKTKTTKNKKSIKNPFTSTTKQPQKYQPYQIRANRAINKQTQESEVPLIDGKVTEAKDLSAPVKNLRKTSKSLHSIQDAHPNVADEAGEDFQYFQKYLSSDGKSSLIGCNSCHDSSERNIVAATALASALIEKSQRHQQQHTRHLSTPVASYEQRYNKASTAWTTLSNSATTKSTQKASGSRVKKAAQKTLASGTRPASARCCHAAAVPKTAKGKTRPKSAKYFNL